MKKRTNQARKIFLFFLLLLIPALIWMAIRRGGRSYKENLLSDPEPSLDMLWTDKDYVSIIGETERLLENDPLNTQVLIYRSAALFYFALSQSSQEEKLLLLNKAIFSLRQYLSLDQIGSSLKAHYLLGKSYIHKGPYYAESALYHLSFAYSEGYESADLYEYLAEAYSYLGDYKSSLFFLEKIADQQPTDRVYLKLAENSYKNGDYSNAEIFYKEALNRTNDDILYQKILYDLALFYYELKNYEQSQKVLSQYLEIDYNSRDAHFMLGESFYYLGDNQSARLEWRRAERLDPYYRPVLVRLYN